MYASHYQIGRVVLLLFILLLCQIIVSKHLYSHHTVMGHVMYHGLSTPFLSFLEYSLVNYHSYIVPVM